MSKKKKIQKTVSYDNHPIVMTLDSEFVNIKFYGFYGCIELSVFSDWKTKKFNEKDIASLVKVKSLIEEAITFCEDNNDSE